MGLKARRENRISINDLIKDVDISQKRNKFISDGDNAVSLVAGFISTEQNSAKNQSDRVRAEIEKIFSFFREVTFDGEFDYYQRMMKLCDRLGKQKKVSNKAVVGFGGQFSAGKSAFINAISGIENVLPEAQNPTTSIPTYIILGNSDENLYSASTVQGVEVPLDKEQMEAITHEFHDEYGIGFSSFIENITVEAKNYKLPANIALLDTPGYSKYDNKSDSKQTFSDKEKSTQQLKTADYLIWLVDIENGVIKTNDIKFIENLDISNEILVVLNKADKKTSEEIEKIVEYCKNTLDEQGIEYFGVAAYSSRNRQEYTDGIIPKFFEHIAENQTNCDNSSGNIRWQIYQTEKEMSESVKKYSPHLEHTVDALWIEILNSDNFMNIQSVIDLWSNNSMKLYNLKKSISGAKKQSREMHKLLDRFFGSNDENDPVLKQQIIENSYAVRMFHGE